MTPAPSMSEKAAGDPVIPLLLASKGSAQTSIFTVLAKSAATQAGRPTAFCLAIAVVFVWLFTGPYFRYSDTWQLVINTGTTVVTFLMVFLIQNSQSRDTRALEIKLDELIRVTPGAHLRLLDIEEFDDDVLQRLQQRYANLARLAHVAQTGGTPDTGTPDMELWQPADGSPELQPAR